MVIAFFPLLSSSKANLEFFGIYNHWLIDLSCEILLFVMETEKIVRRYFFENQYDISQCTFTFWNVCLLIVHTHRDSST